MDLCIIENQYFGKEWISSNFPDLSVTYESDLQKAMDIVSEEIMNNPTVAKFRQENNITERPGVMVRELGESGISLRASVPTLTVEENFGACSEIRKSLVLRIQADPDVEFAYPHVEIVPQAKR